MISINNNLSAANVANTLSGHYGRLKTSTERLSSGLRINGAADDAAGLAIRELMRGDITALQQGMRNVNDAISMIQTFDGALGVIDEKLIRMKELAEQAATGTYDSTQRLMIDSEFQAMGAEINRIARATDFNGIKLINGEDADNNGAAGIATRQIVPVGDKDYDISEPTGQSIALWPGATATQIGVWDTSGITDPSKLVGLNNLTLTNDNIPKIGNNFLLVTPNNSTTNIPPGTSVNIRFDHQFTNAQGNVYGDWYISVNGGPESAGTGDGKGFMWTDPNGSSIHIQTTLVDANGNPTSMTGSGTATWTAPNDIPSFTSNKGTVTATLSNNDKQLDIIVNLDGVNSISGSFALTYGTNVSEPSTALSSASVSFEVKDVTQQPVTPTGPTDPDNPLAPNYKIPDDVVRIHFGTGADKKEDFYDIKKYDATLKGLGLEGVDIQTQERAQDALVSVNDAIVAKDKIRADYGAMQNRMENTLTNLSIQSENLQAAESRISDTDIANEMMQFVRNQILTQSAVAMLAQANSFPQMVMSLIR